MERLLKMLRSRWENRISRIKLLGTIGAGPTLAMLAVLLLLCATAVSGTATAQEELVTASCIQGNELPAELAELDLEGLQAALQERIDEDPNVMVILSYRGEEVATVRADLLLADQAVLAALLEDGRLNVTYESAPGDDGLIIVTDIEVSAEEDCRFYPGCTVLELPSELAELDVAGLRAELRAQVEQDADALVTLTYSDAEARVRADFLLGLDDAVLAALVQGEPVSSLGSTITGLLIEITLPAAGECGEDGGGEPKPGTIPDNQQGGGKDTTPDNQQDGEDKDTGAGDDQQGGVKPTAPDNQQTGAGKTPDNQQGGGDTVTKTFELTLNGTVPADQEFYAVFAIGSSDGQFFYFCGPTREKQCVGDGTVYTASVDIPAGYDTETYFYRVNTDTGEKEEFASYAERIDEDMTNRAWYTFGKGTGAGDDQQDDVQDDSTGTGDDAQDDTQDDQQGEMPEEMPDTGAGGLAAGATIPVGNAAGLTMLLGAGYAVIRKR